MHTAESLADFAAAGVPLDPPPSEALIDDTLARLGAAFEADSATIEAARRLLHARFAIRMEMGRTLQADDEHRPWLARRAGSIEPFFWNRYRQLLVRQGWPAPVVATLGSDMERVLDLLGDPSEPEPWKRRGLVVGDVQSGKTASYAALICKAADAGYRLVVLLTGTLENVRRQTQERLDAAFVGVDSRDLLAAPGQVRRKTHLGVGLIDGRRDGIVFTSREQDFRKNAAQALGISLASVREPVLVVSKKHKMVLKRLADWLRSRNADGSGQIDLPLLLIDDEADNASINTRQDVGETTAINAAIRDLLRVFRRSSYVGFTATPFANIFIDPVSTDEMLGDDLFPRDFIHVLSPPSNYVGMQAIFPPRDPDEPEPDDVSRAMLRTIDDDAWLPPTHRKNEVVESLPDSLRRAIDCFLLACAIRDLRAADDADGAGGGIHRSMLVNVSRFTAVQNAVAAVIAAELETIRHAVRLHGRRAPDEAEAASPVIRSLRAAFDAEYARCGHTWPRVLDALHEAIAPVTVKPVNRDTGAASLDYALHKEAPGLRVIAVGGNSLSRGLTLEGLSTSYFLRNAKAYDTLLQMGRWFGYRGGYQDLCRLWLTDEAEGWYRHVAEATAELKNDFARMQRRGATPREFGLRVRRHPDTLLITARNKMTSGFDVELRREISLAGRGIETATLVADKRRNQENFALTRRLIASLVARHGAPQASPAGKAVRWLNVSNDTVADFLDAFLVHALNHDFQGDSIAEALRARAATAEPGPPGWTVALPVTGQGGPVDLPEIAGLPIEAKRRSIKVKPEYGALVVSRKSARVGSLRDVLHGLSAPERSAAESEAQAAGEKPTEDVYRQKMSSPLLLIYLLRGVAGDDGRSYHLDGQILPALGLHFPAGGGPEKPSSLIRYRLNRIAQLELFGDQDDEPAADPDDDDD